MMPQTHIRFHVDMLVEHRANRGCQFKEYLTAVQITDHKPHIRLKK